MHRASRWIVAVVVLGGFFGVTTSPASAGGPGQPDVKISKHEKGPFSDALGQINIPGGVKKKVYFKVKTVAAGTLAIDVTGTGDGMLDDDYRIKWFRGSKNVTDKVAGVESHHISIDPGEVKRYEARVRHFDIQPDGITFCLQLVAAAPANTDVASIGVNSPCT